MPQRNSFTRRQAVEPAGISIWPGVCIALLGSSRPRSVLTAHLAIHYTSASPASSIAAAAGGSALPGANGSAGFLAALIDQLLAGAAAAPASGATPTPSTSGTAGLASILDA